MIKVFATEMAQEVMDNAMQAFGAMGMTKELPLQLMAQQVRVQRIYEGPTEVHRMAIARRVLEALGSCEPSDLAAGAALSAALVLQGWAAGLRRAGTAASSRVHEGRRRSVARRRAAV